jgi:hypothetical protein
MKFADLELMLAALGLLLHGAAPDPASRRQLLRLAERIRAELRAAAPAVAAARQAREAAKERRDARRLSHPSRAELDAWHQALRGRKEAASWP